MTVDLGGRPTKYKEEYLRFSRNMSLMGHSDEEIAFVLGVDLETLAYWAWNYEEFFNAITPSEKDIQAYQLALKKKEESKQKRLKSKREWQNKKREKSVSFRLECAVRARMTHALKGNVKSQSIRDLPYTTSELMNHLESLFSHGMSWGNYGDWHVDHIKPCAKFNHSIKDQFQECWALSNLQPLWARDNLSKGDRYE